MRHRHINRHRRFHGKTHEHLQAIRIALAGNANVGKSVIFNELTGLHQHVGNWPGKTVERAEGSLVFQGRIIDVLDLPGIYSLSTYSTEELVSREYIAVEQPDTIVNVVDASNLERNLFFTLQLMELEPRMIMALNQIDMAEKKGITVDHKGLSMELGFTVIPTIAPKGFGLEELMTEVIGLSEREKKSAEPIKFGDEIEKGIDEVIQALEGFDSPYPIRWIAIKLLERDVPVSELVYSSIPNVREEVERVTQQMERIHGHDSPSIIASERYALANSIASIYVSHHEPKTSTNLIENITTHPVLGYVFMLAVITSIFFGIFKFGDYMTGIMEFLFNLLKNVYDSSFGYGSIQSFVWKGLIEGVVAGVTIALPYIVPFYFVLSVLEDSGYLTRIAFLMDSFMHKIGLHGKGFIPLMLGFGCSVPATLGSRIMETERERIICAFAATLIPCAARSVVIMGLVAEYVGFTWAVILYILDLALIFIIGHIAKVTLPGESFGLIMEMPQYRMPSMSVTAKRTWIKLQHFITEAFPIMVAGNLVIQLADMAGLLNFVQIVLKPVTVGWLGLPMAVGVTLIFGILRKELTLILLASVLGTTNFALVLTPVQMFVFAFVVMIYVPCIATIGALVKEFGLKKALSMSLIEIALAVFLGGILSRVFLLVELF